MKTATSKTGSAPAASLDKVATAPEPSFAAYGVKSEGRKSSTDPRTAIADSFATLRKVVKTTTFATAAEKKKAAREGVSVWTRADYVAAIDAAESALAGLKGNGSTLREKYGQPLYFRARVAVGGPLAGKSGVFGRKVGEKGTDWTPGPLSNAAGVFSSRVGGISA